MKYYQDLLEAGENEENRMDFIIAAINEHKSSDMYRTAMDAEEYDAQRNVAIMTYRKWLYNAAGQAEIDRFSPNHKLCSNFFNLFTTQQNQYLLGNGMTLEDDNNKAKLGKDFDTQLQELGRDALVQGESFGFWNYDHLEVFKLTEFVPLYDEETAALSAGIRFFQIEAGKPLRATLYEIDGYTDYLQDSNKQMRVLNPKRNYVQVTQTSEANGTQIVGGMNYSGFPIIPLWGNRHKQSELVGLRENIDAYDLIKSGFANDLDGNLIYWILKNSGGMDDVDIAKFMERLRTLGATTPEDESDVTAHEVPIPYEAREAYLSRLEQDMYRDYQALNVADISGGSKTATEIKAAYQPFDNKADRYEYCILKFLDALFNLVGIEDNPTFTRDKVASSSEDVNTLMTLSPYLDDEYVVKKGTAYIGDPDAAQGIIDRKEGADLDRLFGGGNNNGTGTGNNGNSAVTGTD